MVNNAQITELGGDCYILVTSVGYIMLPVICCRVDDMHHHHHHFGSRLKSMVANCIMVAQCHGCCFAEYDKTG